MPHTGLDPSTRARPAGPNIVHESFEGEVVIVDRMSGRYYGLDGPGAEIWRLMLAGHSVRDIAAVLAGRPECARSEPEEAVGSLLGELCEEGIVVAIGADGRDVTPERPGAPASAWPRPPAEPGPAAAFRAGRQALDAYGFFPTAAQELLLRAALLANDAARDALVEWRGQIDLDAIDQASFRLLPLLYRNLLRHRIAVDPPLERRLRDMYRQHWFRMQLLVGTLTGVVQHFERAGMRTLLLKGVPIGLRYYPTLACRPMSDADLLIRAEDADRALTVARAAGLVPQFQPGEWPPRFSASRSFTHTDGWEIDIHTHVMHGRLGRSADQQRWARAQPLDLGAVTSLALAPEDALLHVIGHGLRRNALAPVRWVADAALIIRASGPGLDWAYLVSEARASRLSLVLRRALQYLHDRLDIDVPTAVLDRCAVGAGVAERFEFRAHLASGPAGWTGVALSDWLRARADERRWRGPSGFVRYLQDRLDLDSAWRLPAAIGQIAIDRATRRRKT